MPLTNPLAGRRTARTRRLHEELISTIARALPGHPAGLAAVVQFQSRRCRALRRWPVLGERVRVSSVWTPDNGDHSECLWSRTSHRPAAGAVFDAAQLRALDRRVRRLERRGAYRLPPGSAALGCDDYLWMFPEDAYPGLDRLVLTITPAGSADSAEEGQITAAAARHNRDAVLWPGSGWDPLRTGAAALPCIEVARAKVYGYVEAVGDGLRLVASVHLGRRLPRALARDGLVPLQITVNGIEVFDGLFPQSSQTADEVPPGQEIAARHNREAELFGGSGWDPLGEGGAALPCIQVAGMQVYGYVEGFGDGFRLVVSLHLDGGEEEIPPELLRGDLVPVRIAANGVEVFAA